MATRFVSMARQGQARPVVALVEPFYGGSHRQLVDLLGSRLREQRVEVSLCILPARKWHWRLQAASLRLAGEIPAGIRVLFATSMVNLTELLGLRPDLGSSDVKKVLYFHENQLTYPVQAVEAESGRTLAADDFHMGWAQIMSCLAADAVVFNSRFNLESFLGKVDAFINRIPEQQLRVHGVAAKIRLKSSVLYFPVEVPPSPLPHDATLEARSSQLLTILWNHRWEYDKNPNEFFQTLLELEASETPFRVIVLGEGFVEGPPIFKTALETLSGSQHCTIVHWGYARTREQYFELLRQSDVVVSTSNHEFFGVAVLEAVLCGCYPLVPNRLVYPEIFHPDNLFSTQRQLAKKLRYLCRNPYPARKFFSEHKDEFSRFTWESLRPQYMQLLRPD